MKKGAKTELCPDEFRLELLTDIDMLLMFEKGIRDRIIQAVKHYAKANNKYMKDLYNPDKENIYLSTWIQTTFTDQQWFKNYLHMYFYGRRQRTLPLKKRMKLSKKKREDIFSTSM